MKKFSVTMIEECQKLFDKVHDNIKKEGINNIYPSGGCVCVDGSTDEKTAYQIGFQTPQGFSAGVLKGIIWKALEGITGVVMESLSPNRNYEGMWRVVFVIYDDIVFNGKIAPKEDLEGTWYGVTSAYYSNGRVTAAITEVRTGKEPESTSTTVHDRDIYMDWFSSEESAKTFIKNTTR